MLAVHNELTLQNGARGHDGYDGTDATRYSAGTVSSITQYLVILGTKIDRMAGEVVMAESNIVHLLQCTRLSQS
jgi:hypothetical protein